MQIRIGVTAASSSQLECIARLSRDYGDATVRVASDPSLQFQAAKAESIPCILEALQAVGLCGPDGDVTAENIVACPRAGSCPRERFNVAPYALAVAVYLRSFDGPPDLLREHKIAFSGCPSDCALAAVADLGFFAQLRDGVKGFAVRVGGGLGPPPAVGVQVEEFVRDDEVFVDVEVVRRLVDKYDDRSGRGDTSMRSLVEHLGADEFVQCYREERARVAAEGLARGVLEVTGNVPGTEIGEPEEQKGLDTLRVALPGGDVSADDLSRVAQAARSFGTDVVHVTIYHHLLLPGMSHDRLDRARQALRGLDLSF